MGMVGSRHLIPWKACRRPVASLKHKEMPIELQDEHAYVSEDTLRKHMTDMLWKIDRGESSDRKKPTIHKVPDSLRQVCPDAYGPKLVSIGPLHHNKPELKQMDHLKWKYLKDLIERSIENHGQEDYYNAACLNEFIKRMWQLQEDVKNQYSVDIDMKAAKFVEVLVLDGCFLVELLIKQATGTIDSPLGDAMWNMPMLRKDLFLLENQIPFSVLDALFNIAFPQGFPSRTLIDEEIPPPLGIMDFALYYIGSAKKEVEESGQNLDQIHHLLHMYHICQLLHFNTAPMQNPASNVALRACKKITSGPLNCFFFFVSLILMCKIPRNLFSKRAEVSRMIPSAKNLKEAGVKFKAKRNEGNGCFLNVSFDEESGTLEIPFLYLHHLSDSFFRNFIALEQCCRDAQPHFTAYASFMDDIIDTAEDVEILVRNGIIQHKLGTNEVVANLFNNLCKGATVVYYENYQGNLYRQVNKYHALDRHKWRAALVNSYFHNPWAVASIIAAIILLLLTLGATVATIWQTKYTVKSYKKQFH